MEESDSRYKDYPDHFLGEKPLILSERNRYFVYSYLAKVKKRSDGAYRNHKSTLKSFFNYTDKSADQIKRSDVLNYFDVLDQKELKVSTKRRHRSYLRSFFSYLIKFIIKEDDNFHNPVPDYDFTEKSYDIKKQSEENQKLLTLGEISRILDYCRKNLSKKTFIFFGLGILSGARGSEIRTIRTKDINLEERYFETGFKKNARKGTLKSRVGLLFFFPIAFRIHLKNYMLGVKGKYLFPTQIRKFPSTSWVQYKVKKIRTALGFYFTMHYFRHSIITYLKINGCHPYDSKMLVNHKINDIQADYYTHLSIPQKREIYDRYFPYYSIKYFQI